MSREDWSEQADGSRMRRVDGIRIVDRSRRRPTGDIEHLVTWSEPDGRAVVLGLDSVCRPVYITAL
jgi:hypothetical protein